MWELEIENVGGIRDGSPTLEAGVNAVQASNWQGKTSLVTAVRTVLGGALPDSVVTEGASEGSVRLTTTDGTYNVSLSRQAGTVVRDGTPYLTDEQDRLCAELFAFLDGDNRIRTAVRNGADLTPHLIEPLEVEDIAGQIESLRTQRRDVEAELDDAREAKSALPDLTEQLNDLESALATKRDELESITGADDENGDRDALQAELREARQQRERARQRRSRLEQKIESVETQIEEAEAELDELEVPSAPELSNRLETKRDRLTEVEANIETLESLYNVNKRIIEQDQVDLVTEVTRQVDTDQLACWVCGSETTRSEIEDQLPALGAAVTEWRERRSELEDEVDELRSRQQSIERKERRKRSLEQDLDDLRMTLEESREDAAATRERIEELDDEVDRLAEQVEETDDRRSTLEGEIARTEARLEDKREEKGRLAEQAAVVEELEQRRDDLAEEIESLRSRRERVVDTAREAFEAALEDVVEQFDPSFDGAHLQKHVDADTGETERLELIIARDGRETTVDALSEGEVELVGLIAALAGHEAFDVAERVPCLLLDDVGGLAAEHLQMLAAYLEGRATYVVTTAYPEAGTFDGHTLSPAEWDVVSDGAASTAQS
ncbi:archaea-specific SMC-related protein (plasmid) [Haloarcula salina]|uniref:archaea-specific SMC-related protein n=1 Tax=Haloarcula salina TaxID=1429914 RepID=UPI003C6F735E